MHSDLEEGEIRDEVIIPELSEVGESITYFNTKGNCNMISGTFGKITLKRGRNYLYTHSKNNMHSLLAQDDDSTIDYLGIVQHSSKTSRVNRKRHLKSFEDHYRSNPNQKKRKSSLLKSHSYSSCSHSSSHDVTACHPSSKNKSGNFVNENKKPKNIMPSYKRKYYSKCKSYMAHAKNSSLTDHKKDYSASFTKYVTEPRSNNITSSNGKINVNKLKVCRDKIKPGSIGEMLLNRKQNDSPIEIVLSDSDHCIPPSKDTSLSDDELLMILRKKALDSIDPNSTECNSSTSKTKLSNGTVIMEVHNEPVDMEISISDDESKFPIEWAFMVPPPTNSKNDNNIQTLNRWCYDQNMCIQAMQSTSKDINNSALNNHIYSPQSNPNEFCSTDNTEPTDDISENDFVNLTGGYAKQYEAFMANFGKEQHPFTNSNNKDILNQPNDTPILKSNLITIPLQVLNNENESYTSIPIKNLEEEEYDEDLLLAELLIGQVKGKEKENESNPMTPKLSDFPKKRTKKQSSYKKKIKPVIQSTSKSIDGWSSIPNKMVKAANSNFIECGNYTFPKIKPVIINLQPSDSENDSPTEKDNTNDIDSFIRSIRNSKQDNTIAEATLEPESNKTPRALSFLSKTKQEDYKLLKEKLRKKLTSKSQLSKKLKIFTVTPNKNASCKIKKKLSKFNFSMDNLHVKAVNSNLCHNGCENTNDEPAIIESSAYESEVPKHASVLPIKEIATIDCGNIKEVATANLFSELQTSQVDDSINNNEDDEFALRSFLLKSLKSKCNLTINNIAFDSKGKCNDTLINSYINNMEKEDSLLNSKMQLNSSNKINTMKSKLVKNFSKDNNNATKQPSQHYETLTELNSPSNKNVSLSETIEDNSVVNNNTDNSCNKPATNEEILTKPKRDMSKYELKLNSPTNIMESKDVEKMCLVKHIDNSRKQLTQNNEILDLKMGTGESHSLFIERSLLDNINVYEVTSPQIDNKKIGSQNELSNCLHTDETGVPIPVDCLKLNNMTLPASCKDQNQTSLTLNSSEDGLPIGENIDEVLSTIGEIKKELVLPPIGKLNKEMVITPIVESRKESVLSPLRECRQDKLKVHPPVIDKRKEEGNLLKHIEQEVVKERNKVFSSRQRLTEDIKRSERYFTDVKSISSLISSLKVQLVQAEQKISNKVADAKINIGTLYEKKGQLKEHINKSKELQLMGEKLGKQVIGSSYTFPPPSSNYEAEYAKIESDLCLMKNKIQLITLAIPKSNITHHLKTVQATAASKKSILSKNLLTVKKQKFKIDKRMKKDQLLAMRQTTIQGQPVLKQMTPVKDQIVAKGSNNIGMSVAKQQINKTKLEATKYLNRYRPINPESRSDFDILCPHALLGRCNDDSCIFIHLSQNREETEEKPSNSSTKLNIPSLGPDKQSNVNSVTESNTSPLIFNVSHVETESNIEVSDCEANKFVDSAKSPIKLKRGVVCLNRLSKFDIDKICNINSTIRDRLRKRKS